MLTQVELQMQQSAMNLRCKYGKLPNVLQTLILLMMMW